MFHWATVVHLSCMDIWNHFTRSRAAGATLSQFPTALALACTFHLPSSTPSIRNQTNTTQLKPHPLQTHFHHPLHQTYIHHICTSQQYTQTLTSTALPHITSHIMATGTHSFNCKHHSTTMLTTYSEPAQRLREEQPRALQRSLRVRDHL